MVPRSALPRGLARTALATALAGSFAACGGFVTTSGAEAADAATEAAALDGAGSPPDSSAPTPPPKDAALAGDAGDSSVSDAALDAERDTGRRCVSDPREGAACAPAVQACGEVDLCCSGGFAWECAGGAWARSSTGTLCLLCTPTPCGTTPCRGDQLCVELTSATPGTASTFSCVAYPAGCSDDWTCGCVTREVGCTMSTCAEPTAHHVHLTCSGI